MSAEVLAFPAARRPHMVADIAAKALRLPYPRSDDSICRALDRNAERLRRRGVSEERIRADRTALCGAINAAVWAIVMCGGHGGDAA